MESLRTGLISVGVIVFLVTYVILLLSAFKRDMLWGILSLFAPPFGGWAHAITDRFLNGRMLAFNLSAAALAAVTAFWFPRPPVTGYWTDEYGEFVLRLDPDGRVRNYELAPDGHFSFRGFKIGTAQLSVPSNTRLKIEGIADITYGYLNPESGVIDLYTTMNDPELGLAADRGGTHIRLLRVQQPLDAKSTAALALLEQREAVLDVVKKFCVARDPATPPPLGPSVMDRYARHVEDALTLKPDALAKRPFPEIVEIIRLRAVHGPALRSGTTAAALFKQDLAADAFHIQELKRFEVADISVYPERRQALVQLHRFLGRGEFAYEQISAEKGPNGVWGLDVDWHVLLGTPTAYAGEAPPSLDQALSYADSVYACGVSKDWLAPIR